MVVMVGGVSGEEFTIITQFYLLSRFDFVNLLLRGQSSTYFYNLKPNIFVCRFLPVQVELMSGVSLDIPVVLFDPSRPVHYLNVLPPGRSSGPHLWRPQPATVSNNTNNGLQN